MVPLIALVAGLAAFRGLGAAGIDALDSWQVALRGGLALMFVLTGTAHFSRARRADLIAMVPPQLPRPELLVTATGVLELLGAAGLLLPATARPTAACLAVLLVAMFPANVYAARRGPTLAGRAVTPLPLRTALQLVFLAAALAIALAPAG